MMGRIIAVAMLAMALVIGGIGYYAGARHLFAPAHAVAADECQTFAETGMQVCGRFLQYWRDNGGLAKQGLPLSGVLSEKSSVDGKMYQVQYFERAVFELHPENAPPYDVLLSLLGREKYLAKYPSGGSSAPPASPPPATPFPRTASSRAVTVTIYAVQDNVPGGSFKPKAGYRWFAVDASVKNISGENIPYNSLYGTLQTTDNREWDQPIGGKEPDFKYGTMQPNQTVRGWFTFEVAVGATPMTFSYDPTYGDNPLSIPLR